MTAGGSAAWAIVAGRAGKAIAPVLAREGLSSAEGLGALS
jgi:hypothetical protein